MSVIPKFWSFYTWENFSRVKPIEWVLKEAATSELAEGHGSSMPLLSGKQSFNSEEGGLDAAPKTLGKKLGVWDLVFYGVGSTVGAGIFSLIGPGLAKTGACVADTENRRAGFLCPRQQARWL